MLRKIREILTKVLLSEQAQALEETRQVYQKLINQLPTASEAYREQMKGFNGTELNSYSDLEEIYDTEDGLEAFMANVKSLSDNPALDAIINLLKRNQLQFTALESENLEQVNFGRATVNGLQLFREEVDRLVGVYKEMHKHEDEFDPNEVL